MTRPTFSVELITGSGQTLTIPANTRAVVFVGHREGSHGLTAVSIGGVSLANDATNGRSQNPETGMDLHLCTWMIGHDVAGYAAFAGRSSDVITFTGATVNNTSNDDNYKGYVVYVIHATRAVEMATEAASQPEVAQTQDISHTINPGASVDAGALLLVTTGGFNYTGPLSGQTDLYGPSQIDTDGDGAYRWASTEAITGSHALGGHSGAGTNPHAAMIGQGWIEGDVLDTAYVLGDPGEYGWTPGGVLFGPTGDIAFTLAPVAFDWTPGGVAITAEADWQVRLASLDGIETPAETEEGEDGDVLTRVIGSKPVWAPAAGGVTDHDLLTGVSANDHHDRDHASTHGPGGADALKLDDTAAPDDNTDNDATTSKHGLLKKLPGGTTTFLRADGTFSAPAGNAVAVEAPAGTSIEATLDKLIFPEGTATSLGSGDVYVRDIPTGVVAALLTNTAAQTVGTGAWTKAVLNSAVIDTDSGFSDANDRWVCPAGRGGLYWVSAHAGWTSETTGQRYTAIYKNGVIYRLWAEAEAAYTFGPNSAGPPQRSYLMSLAATDYVEVYVLHDRGSNLDTAANSVHLQLFKLGSGNVAGLDAASARRTSGNITANSTSWANLDTGLDLVVPAQAGDRLLISLRALVANEAVALGLDAVTVVSGSPVNSVSASGASDYGFAFGPSSSGDNDLTTTLVYTVVAGDISGGNVTLRLRYKTSGATNKTVYAGTGGSPQLFWSAVNLRSSAVRGYAQGAAFPTGPASGDKFYRTDLKGGMLFRYDGTRWLSDQLFTAPFDASACNQATISVIGGQMAWDSAGLDVYLERCVAIMGVTGTNSGGNVWTMTVYSNDFASGGGGANLIFTSTSTSGSGTGGVMADRSGNVNAVIDVSATPSIIMVPTRAGTAGTLRVWGHVEWRYIAT